MVRVEIGIQPLRNKVNIKMLCYSARLIVIMGKQSKIAYKVYNILKQKYETGEYICRWIAQIHNTLNNLGLNYIWLGQTWYLILSLVSVWSSPLTLCDMSVCPLLTSATAVFRISCWFLIVRQVKSKDVYIVATDTLNRGSGTVGLINLV